MPVVTDIVRQKKNKKYYSIFIENNYLFSLSSDDLNFLQIKINDNISKEKLDNYVKLFSLQKARDYAFRLVSRKSYSERAMKEKLDGKFPEKITNEVIKDLKRLNYIDDRKLILEYAKNKLRLKPMGPFKLKQNLYNKKFEMGLIDSAVGEAFQEYDEYDLALKVFDKRYKGKKIKIDFKLKKKIKDYLFSNGFSSDVVMKVIREIGEKGSDF